MIDWQNKQLKNARGFKEENRVPKIVCTLSPTYFDRSLNAKAHSQNVKRLPFFTR